MIREEIRFFIRRQIGQKARSFPKGWIKEESPEEIKGEVGKTKNEENRKRRKNTHFYPNPGQK